MRENQQVGQQRSSVDMDHEDEGFDYQKLVQLIEQAELPANRAMAAVLITIVRTLEKTQRAAESSTRAAEDLSAELQRIAKQLDAHTRQDEQRVATGRGIVIAVSAFWLLMMSIVSYVFIGLVGRVDMQDATHLALHKAVDTLREELMVVKARQQDVREELARIRGVLSK